MEKPKLIFRQTANNQFTLPVLLNTIEKNHLQKNFSICNILTYSKLLATISKSSKNIILYSFMTTQLKKTWHETQNVKQKLNKDDLLICGGPHPTGNPEECLKLGFDIVFQGAGEKTFPQFLKNYLDNKIPNQKIIIENSPFPLDENFPLSSLSDFAPPLEITRGCYNQCKFCQTSQTHMPQHRSFESIHEYLKGLTDRKYITRAAFINPNGFEYGAPKPGKVHLETIEKLFALVRSFQFKHFDYGIFPTELNPKTVSLEGLNLIKKYCTNKKITIGAQSGTTRMMKKIGRPHTREEIDRTVSLVNQVGLRPQIDIIFGLPEETEEDQQVTLNWMRKLHLDYNARFQVHYFLPLAGTKWEYKLPTPIGQNIQEELIKFNKAGISTNWWQKGIQLSQSIIETKEQIQGMG